MAALLGMKAGYFERQVLRYFNPQKRVKKIINFFMGVSSYEKTIYAYVEWYMCIYFQVENHCS